MKPLAISILLIAAAFSVKAQEVKKNALHGIDLSYYSSPVGSNLSAEYNRNFGKHTLVAGVKWQFNHVIQPSANGINAETFYKQFYARTVADHIGFSLGYKYHLRNINPYVSPYLMVNIQYAHMPTKHLWVSELSPGSMPKPNLVYNGPFNIIETIMGAGLSIKLSNRIALNQSVGVGTPLIWGATTAGGYNGMNFGIAYQLRAGLSFKLD
jgi:hypothetical protein